MVDIDKSPSIEIDDDADDDDDDGDDDDDEEDDGITCMYFFSISQDKVFGIVVLWWLAC